MDSGVTSLLFGLAVVGLIGFSLSLYRAYESVRFAYRSRFKPLSLLPLVAVAALLYAWGLIYYRVIFKCLAEMVCGANRAQGILLLAMFGVVVIGYELLRLLAVHFYRRRVDA